VRDQGIHLGLTKKATSNPLHKLVVHLFTHRHNHPWVRRKKRMSYNILVGLAFPTSPV